MSDTATATADQAQKAIEGEIQDFTALQRTLDSTQAELMQNPEFVQYLELSKQVQERDKQLRADLKEQMAAHSIKSIKGDWGGITLKQRTDLDIDAELLQPKFFKRVPDTEKIKAAATLEGKLPKGVSQKTSQYIEIRFKKTKE